MISKDHKDIDVKAYLEQHGARFDRNGKSVCIFHNEKTPSLTVKYNRFKCWGCGEHGDAVEACMLLYKVSYPEAVRMLTGEDDETKREVKLVKRDIAKDEEQIKIDLEKRKKRLTAIRMNSAELPTEAREFLESRKILDIIDKINTKELSIPLSVKYNEFADFKCIEYFALGKDYIVEKRINPKRKEEKAQNIGEAQVLALAPYKGQEKYTIVEGIEDALSAVANGENAISLNGTSNVSLLLKTLESHKDWFNSRNKKFVILTDTDEPGRKASDKIEEGLKKLGLNYEVPHETIKLYKHNGFKDYNEWWVAKCNGTIKEIDILDEVLNDDILNGILEELEKYEG